MGVRIEEGRLVEFANAGATGIERRAFGEFESARGELASYALGWSTDPEVGEGWVTVGIGVGNPGGATFHARVFAHEGELAYRLIDEPFEDVPQGGPDLTADEARAHDTLPFIWHVADSAMDLDRRGWWLRHRLLGTRAFLSREVFDDAAPVLAVVRDEEGDWQLLGAGGAVGEPRIAHLYHAIDEDPTLLEVLDLMPGVEAVRERRGGPWTRRRFASG